MGHKPNILSPSAKAIKRLIEDNDLGRALDMLDEWVEISESTYWKEVAVLKSQYNRIRKAQLSGSISFAEISAEETKVTWAILYLLEDLNQRAILVNP